MDDPLAHASPSFKALQDWNAERIASVKQQISTLEAKDLKEKEETAGRAMSEKALLKRQEREAKRAAAAALKQHTEGNSLYTPSNVVEPEPRPLTPSVPPDTSQLTYTITVPGSSSTFSWFTPTPNAHSTIETAQAAGVWTYPSTLAERAKCAVFQDLWEKDNFMGAGMKFGGDFLIYPGTVSYFYDSLRTHQSGR